MLLQKKKQINKKVALTICLSRDVNGVITKHNGDKLSGLCISNLIKLFKNRLHNNIGHNNYL